MLTVNEQEILVDDLKEIEIKLFNLSEKLSSNDELSKAWVLVYECLKKEQLKETKMKSGN